MEDGKPHKTEIGPPIPVCSAVYSRVDVDDWLVFRGERATMPLHNFTPDTASRQCRNMRARRGMPLHIPWQALPPPSLNSAHDARPGTPVDMGLGEFDDFPECPNAYDLGYSSDAWDLDQLNGAHGEVTGTDDVAHNDLDKTDDDKSPQAPPPPVEDEEPAPSVNSSDHYGESEAFEQDLDGFDVPPPTDTSTTPEYPSQNWDADQLNGSNGEVTETDDVVDRAQRGKNRGESAKHPGKGGKGGGGRGGAVGGKGKGKGQGKGRGKGGKGVPKKTSRPFGCHP